MLFLLDIILIINIWIAYRYFSCLMAPPVLMGGGMLAASLMATSYYNEWEMDTMLGESVCLLGGGTFFFTICCILFSYVFCISRLNRSAKVELDFLKQARMETFYVFSIIVALVGVVLKLYYMVAQFGALGWAELIVAKRMDDWNGDDLLQIPFYVRQMGSYTSIVAYLTVWLLVIMSISEKKNRRILRILLIVHLMFTFVDGMLSGSKAPILGIIMLFAVSFFFVFYAKRGNFNLSRKFFVRGLVVLVVLASLFRGLSMVIGRNVSERSNWDLLAEYCGAEIKNFDLYLQQNSKRRNSAIWGENTFHSFYSEINPNFERENGEFQYVGDYILGNVYPQFRPFHEDFGIVGIFTMCFFIAFISMFFYSRSTCAFIEPTKINVYVFIYASIAMSIFMSFFSSRFTESICRMGWIRSSIYLVVLVWFVKHYLIKSYVTKK